MVGEGIAGLNAWAPFGGTPMQNMIGEEKGRPEAEAAKYGYRYVGSRNEL